MASSKVRLRKAQMSESAKTENMDAKATSRRKFFMAPAGAAALESQLIMPGQASAASVSPNILTPKEIPEALSQSPRLGEFAGKGMTGAEVFARLCKEENLAALFCCPGNYQII